MRRVGILSRPARNTRALLGAALAFVVIGSLTPAAAFAADETDDAAVIEETAAPEQAEETATPDGSEESATPEESAETATEEPVTPEETEETATPEETDDATVLQELDAISGDAASIPTPENGDYIGSNTSDELDPGAFTSQLTSLSAVAAAKFNPGNIISDSKMYTSGTMTAKQIQYFFDQKVPRCDRGYTCLKDFTMTTVSKSPNSYCSGSYQGGRNESAATIISKVSKACGVSEKVLIVMLQKEQGLVTHVWPSQFRYDIAMGYACPDDAACNSQYFGFQNQMYMAAYQLQRYTKDKYFNWYPVGKTSPVRYHPNIACGAGMVKIENKATAALYYYTPYQPNRAALNAGYGVGDSCSAYGNRNFALYYTEWFGSLHGDEKPVKPSEPAKPAPSAGEKAITAKWKDVGGSASSLGSATASAKCGLRYDGCVREFSGGVITWSASTGAHVLQNRTLSKWKAQKSENGSLGYPTTDLRCGLKNGGCYQQFQGGKTYWNGSSSAVTIISGSSQNKYQVLGNENGVLGYPTTDARCGLSNGGCYQQFVGGKTYWRGNHTAAAIWGPPMRAYQALGNETGKLGYPTTDPKCGLVKSGCYQQFTGGKLYWAGSHSAKAVWGASMSKYQALGNENGVLGYPTTGPACGLRGGGCYQQFEGGKLYWVGNGPAYRIKAQAMRGYQVLGNEHSSLGYPVSDEKCGLSGGGCYQKFERGKLYWTGHNAGIGVWGAVEARYLQLGNEHSKLGYPTTNPSCSNGSCTQKFQRGSMTWRSSNPSGTLAVRYS